MCLDLFEKRQVQSRVYFATFQCQPGKEIIMFSKLFWRTNGWYFTHPIRLFAVLFLIFSTLTIPAQNVIAEDTTPPELTITGATADGTAMLGDLATGFILETRRTPTDEWLIQFAAGTVTNEPLADVYFGLYLVGSTVSATDLKDYYDASGIPDPYLTHLKNAADKSEPFVYIKGSSGDLSVSLVDAAKHEHTPTDVAMTVPDDFPLGTYTVEGQITDTSGNPTTVTLTLIVDIDPVTISGNTGTGGVTLSYDDGGPKTETSNGGGNYSITVPLGWSGTVTPSKSHYNFTPSSNTYTNLTDNVANEDYAASQYNTAPVITESDPQAKTISEDGSPTAFSLTLHASDAEGDTITWSVSSAASNGTATASGIGTEKAIGYTPNAHYHGPDSFVVQISDGLGGTDTITINVTVESVNDVPVAVNDSYSTPQFTVRNVDAPGVLANDTDADVPHVLTAVKQTDPSNGSVTLNSDGSFSYTPTGDFTGEDSFTYLANDGTADSNVATVTIIVSAINHNPTDIQLSNSSVAENLPSGTVVGTLTSSDPDPGDTSFTYDFVDNAGYPDNASFDIVGNSLQTSAVFNFEAKESYSINIRTTDPGTPGLTYDEVFSIAVTNVNEAPTNITLTPTTVAENLPIDTVVGAFNTTDPDTGNTFTYSTVAGTGDTDNAQFNISGGNLRTSAIFDYETKSSYSIRVRSTDQGGILFFEKSFTITVTNVNDPPVIVQGDSVGVVMGEDNNPAFSLILSATDQDVPANTLTWSLNTQAAHGHANVTGTGTSPTLTYTADANYNGSVFFIVQVSDGTATDLITVNITINPDLGDIYYVDQATGNDLDDGLTPATAFLTIAKGASKARPGDTVMVLTGNFAETVKPSFSGLAGYPITFTANPGVIVTGEAGNSANGGAFRLSGFSYIVINGFTIQNTADYGIYALNSSYLTITNNRVTSAGTPGSVIREGIFLLTTTNSTISGNTTDHNSSTGIELLNGSNYNVVSDNISYANAKETVSQATGIECRNSSNNTVIHNIVYANEDTGLNFYAGAASNTVIGNLSYGNGDHGIDHNAAPNNIIIGNTVHGNVTSGINLEATSSGATLANNIAVDNGLQRQVGGGTVPGTKPGNIYVDSTSVSGTTMNYDLVYHSTGTGLVQIWWGSNSYTSLAAFKVDHPTMEVNGLEANPLLKSPAAIAERPAGAPYNVTVNIGDYHILSGSPAIDSAKSSFSTEIDPKLVTDIAGMARYDDLLTTNTGTGTRTYDDRGAYEFEPTDTYQLSILKSGTGTGTVTGAVAGQANTINCGSTCAATYSYGTVVTLTATPTPGYFSRFTGWSGTGISCPGTGTCTVTVTAARTVTATFEKATFTDVPFTHPRWAYIEALYDAGLTAGCQAAGQPLAFCPEATMIRVESAVFMVRGELGAIPTPTDTAPDVFGDDYSAITWGKPWAEKMWDLGMTAGCQWPANAVPKMFCPYTLFTRDMGAVFALRMAHGSNMPIPPGSGNVFADMTDPTYWGTGWAEMAYAEGLLPDCGIDEASGKPLFCPQDELSRSWSAYTIVKAKDIPLPQ